MANVIGYIKCTEPSCQEVAEVRKAGGKRQSLYTHCPACGTNQANGANRQAYLTENLKASQEELTVPVDNLIYGYKSDTEESASIPSKKAASSVSGDSESKPKADTESQAKDIPQAPPILLGVLALGAALITAIFAARKPNKHKEQTA